MKTKFICNLFFAAILLYGTMSMNAQIVCGDIKPDSVVAIPTGTTNQITNDIDLNNDATPDFRINSVQSGGLGFVIFQATQIGTGNFVLDDGANMGLALTLGTPINGTCTTWHAMTGNNVTLGMWSSGSAIGGNFPGAGDRYVGLKLVVGANTYYGWARFNFSSTTNSYTYKDYGYNATNNASIPAGATCASYTPNYTFSGGSLCQGSFINAAISNTAAANSYTWSSVPAGPIFGSPNGSVTTITFPSAGNFTIIASGTQGANTGSYSQTLTVNPNPTLTIVTSNSILCAGQTATLTGSGGTGYNWGSGWGATSTLAITPSVTTNYTVYAVGAGSCTTQKVFTQSVTICNGITEISLNNESFLIYPNPANDKVFVSAKTNKSIVINIEVMDAYGKVVISQKQNFISADNSCVIQTSHLAAGIYFIKMNSEEGGTEVLRLIKE